MLPFKIYNQFVEVIGRSLELGYELLFGNGMDFGGC